MPLLCWTSSQPPSHTFTLWASRTTASHITPLTPVTDPLQLPSTPGLCLACISQMKSRASGKACPVHCSATAVQPRWFYLSQGLQALDASVLCGVTRGTQCLPPVMHTCDISCYGTCKGLTRGPPGNRAVNVVFSSQIGHLVSRKFAQ